MALERKRALQVVAPRGSGRRSGAAHQGTGGAGLPAAAGSAPAAIRWRHREAFARPGPVARSGGGRAARARLVSPDRPLASRSRRLPARQSGGRTSGGLEVGPQPRLGGRRQGVPADLGGRRPSLVRCGGWQTFGARAGYVLSGRVRRGSCSACGSPLPLAVFVLASSRLPLYLLPLFAPFALVTGRGSGARRGAKHRRRGAGGPTALLIVWCAVLLGIKVFAAIYPSHRDARLQAAWIAAQGVGAESELVVVDAVAQRPATVRLSRAPLGAGRGNRGVPAVHAAPDLGRASRHELATQGASRGSRRRFAVMDGTGRAPAGRPSGFACEAPAPPTFESPCCCARPISQIISSRGPSPAKRVSLDRPRHR